jgi:alkyl hydroperoxide reductase subunit AhpC
MTVSDVYKADFGKKYGTLMEEVRVLRRAVFVVDKKRIVRYVDYMLSNSDEPHYEEILATAKAALENNIESSTLSSGDVVSPHPRQLSVGDSGVDVAGSGISKE